MQINVSQLLKEPVGSTRKFKIDEWVGQGKGQEEYRVTGDLTLIHINKGVLVTGSLNASGKALCSRCLKSFDYSTEFDIEDLFSSTIDINTGLPVEVQEDTFAIDEHHNLDLYEALYQNVSLALPMKLLCKEDCAGICPECGRNLNESKCDCDTIKHDQRWSKLRSLKKEEMDNGTIA
jgi:uncharacterized protein